MISNISKGVFPPRIQQFGRTLLAHGKKGRNFESSNEKIGFLGKQTRHGRYYCTQAQPQQNQDNVLPELTNDNLRIVPGIFKTLASIYHLQRQIKRIEPTFEVPEFVSASQQAVEIVSNFLSRENYEALEGLVTDDVIQKLRQKICTLAPSQKELIAIRMEDIYGYFPYSIRMLFDGQGDNQRSYAEIYMVYYSLRGFQELKEKNIHPPLQLGSMSEYRDKIFVANYRFIKDYTNGTDGPWIINLLNQAMLAAYGQARKRKMQFPKVP